MTITIICTVAHGRLETVQTAKAFHILLHIWSHSAIILVHGRNEGTIAISGGFEIRLRPTIAVNTYAFIDIAFAVNCIRTFRECDIHMLLARPWTANRIVHRPSNHIVTLAKHIAHRYVTGNRISGPISQCGIFPCTRNSIWRILSNINISIRAIDRRFLDIRRGNIHKTIAKRQRVIQIRSTRDGQTMRWVNKSVSHCKTTKIIVHNHNVEACRHVCKH